jgi:hypothetical protein
MPKKYENPPITTTEGFAHRGSSPSTRIHDEFNYSLLGFGFLVCNLVSLFEFPRTLSNAIVVIKKKVQQGNKTSRRIQERKTPETKKNEYSYTPTSLAPTTTIGATR